MPNFDPLIVVVGREEVEASNTSVASSVLSRLISTPEMILKFRMRVDIAFDGYNDVRDELFEIPAVRQFVAKLDAEFPYWLYFMSRSLNGLQCISRCFLLPFLSARAQADRHPRQLADLIERRWGPALNHICAGVGLTDEEADGLLLSAMDYFRYGPAR